MSALPVGGYLLPCQDTSSVAELFSAVPQGTGTVRCISADARSCSWQAAPGQRWGQSSVSRECHGGGCGVCAPLPSWTNPWKNKRRYSCEKGPTPFFKNTSNGSVLRQSAWQGGTRLLETVHSIASLATRKSKFFGKNRSKILGTSIYIYSYHGQEKRVLRRVVSTSLEFLPTHQRHSLTMLEIYWWEHDVKHSKSINNEGFFNTPLSNS